MQFNCRSFLLSMLVFGGWIIAFSVLAATPNQRAEIAKAAAQGDSLTADKLYADAAATSFATDQFSVFYEQLESCGLYPQETRLVCAIKIKQPFGYGGPVGAPGTHEHVLFCLDWNNDNNFSLNEMAGAGIVQIHDEASPAPPPWQYAVYRDVAPPGGPRTSNTGATATSVSSGPSIKTRAILSWYAPVKDCNSRPVWGNILDFTVRFDPIR